MRERERERNKQRLSVEETPLWIVRSAAPRGEFPIFRTERYASIVPFQSSVNRDRRLFEDIVVLTLACAKERESKTYIYIYIYFSIVKYSYVHVSHARFEDISLNHPSLLRLCDTRQEMYYSLARERERERFDPSA